MNFKLLQYLRDEKYTFSKIKLQKPQRYPLNIFLKKMIREEKKITKHLHTIIIIIITKHVISKLVLA